jgi:long-chain acyl-CoA synthetase
MTTAANREPASPNATLPPGFQSMTFADAIRAACARDPDKVAIIDGERSISYRQLVDRLEAFRDVAIGHFGLNQGQRAAIIARNRLEYIEIVAGLPDAGIAVATINPRMTAPEVAVTLKDCQPSLIIVDEASLQVVQEALPDCSIPLISLGAVYEGLLVHRSPQTSLPRINEWDPWTIPYTSGTTGKPKGVVLSHRSRMLVALISAAEFGCFGYDDKFLAIAPLNHGGGLGFAASSIANGGTLELLDQFDPIVTLDRLKHGGVTGIFMVPTHFQMIFDLPADQIAPYSRPPITSIISNAAPLPQAMKEKIIPWFGDGVLHEIYGSTEAALVCNLRPQWHLLKERCVGTPMPHVSVEVRREDGSICDPGEIGELFSRSPMHFNGYLNRDDETAATIQGDWVTVGDLAMRDNDGFLYIVDRKKDMVISGGVNIYPREIEEVLLRHPAIADIAVVGIADERWGEVLKAFAVIKPGLDLTVQDIAEFCAGRLSPYKIPKQLAHLESLPRNANGKVIKRELR